MICAAASTALASARDHQAVAPQIHQHLDLAGLGAQALLHQAGHVLRQPRLEPHHAGLFLGGLGLGRVELADDRLDAGDFFFPAADHDPVLAVLRHERGGAAGGLGPALDLFLIELLHKRHKLRRRAAKKLHAFELAHSAGPGSVQLPDEVGQARHVARSGQDHDLAARGIRDELGRQLRVGLLLDDLAHELRRQGGQLGGRLGDRRHHGHVAAGLGRGRVQARGQLLDLDDLLLGGRDEQAVVGRVGHEQRFGLVGKPRVVHPLGHQVLEPGQAGLDAQVGQRNDLKPAVALGFVGGLVERAQDLGNLHQLLVSGGGQDPVVGSIRDEQEAWARPQTVCR